MKFSDFYKSVLKEGFNFDYRIPKDPNQLVADFYAMFSVHKTDADAFKDLRDEELGFSLEYANKQIIKGLYKFLNEAVLRACACEIVHFQAFYDTSLQEEFLEKNEYLKNMFEKLANAINPDEDGYSLQRLNAEGNRYEIRWKVISHISGFNPSDFVYFCKVAFSQRYNMWHSSYGGKAWKDIAAMEYSYGGKAWKDIADAWMAMESAYKKFELDEKSREIYGAIDHVVDIEHNNGSILTKWRGVHVSSTLIDLKADISHPYKRDIYGNKIPLKNAEGEYIKTYDKHRNSEFVYEKDETKPISYQKLIPWCSPQIQPAFYAAYKDLFGHSADKVEDIPDNDNLPPQRDSYDTRKDLIPRETSRNILGSSEEYNDDDDYITNQEPRPERERRPVADFQISEDQLKLFKYFVTKVLKGKFKPNPEDHSNINYINNFPKEWQITWIGAKLPLDLETLAKNCASKSDSIWFIFSALTEINAYKVFLYIAEDMLNNPENSKEVKNKTKIIISCVKYFIKNGKTKKGDYLDKLIKTTKSFNGHQMLCCKSIESLYKNKKIKIEKILDSALKIYKTQEQPVILKSMINLRNKLLADLDGEIMKGDYVYIKSAPELNNEAQKMVDSISEVKYVDEEFIKIYTLDKKSSVLLKKENLQVVKKGKFSNVFANALKVGDVVEIVTTKDGHKGDICKIIKVDMQDRKLPYKIMYTYKLENWYGFNDVKKTDKPFEEKKDYDGNMHGFKFGDITLKIGDIIEVVKKFTEDSKTFRVGEQAKIIYMGSNQGSGIEIEWDKEVWTDGSKNFVIGVNFLTPEYFKIVKKSSEENSKTFKIGDKVKIIGKTVSGIDKIGEIGTIENYSDYPHSDTYWVVVGDNPHSYLFPKNSIEKIKDEEEDSKKIKIGDFVQIVGPDDKDNTLYIGGEGRVGLIFLDKNLYQVTLTSAVLKLFPKESLKVIGNELEKGIKAGDTVKILHTTRNSYKVGEEYEVKEVYSTNGKFTNYEVWNKEKTKTSTFYPTQVKKVEKNQEGKKKDTRIPIDSSYKFPIGIEVGDTIEVMKDFIKNGFVYKKGETGIVRTADSTGSKNLITVSWNKKVANVADKNLRKMSLISAPYFGLGFLRLDDSLKLKEKFKIGDKVNIIGNNIYNTKDDYLGKWGKIQTIPSTSVGRKIYTIGLYKLKRSLDTNDYFDEYGSYYGKSLELIKDEDIPVEKKEERKFKSGDFVECIKTIGSVKRGDTGVIISVYSTVCWVDWVSSMSGYIGYDKIKKIEKKIENKTGEKKKENFKIGDRIEVIKDFIESGIVFNIGMKGTVKKIQEMYMTIEWDDENKLFHQYSSITKPYHGFNIFSDTYKCLKLINKEGSSKEEDSKKIENKTGEKKKENFKIGDNVRIIGPNIEGVTSFIGETGDITALHGDIATIQNYPIGFEVEFLKNLY